ncbi:MAG: hypothetical protein QHH75_10360 [Bacillota bacterium]|nr:hypothetical protein [Bacillota bacterium]
MLGQIRRIFKDERGAYGGVELAVIIGIVLTVTMAILNAFKGDGTTTGLPGAANNVVDTVTSTINNAAGSGTP